MGYNKLNSFGFAPPKRGLYLHYLTFIYKVANAAKKEAEF